MALSRAWKQMSWFYYQYLLVTALYMLEPWERTVFSILTGRGRGARGGILPDPGQTQGLRGGGGGRGGDPVGTARARGLASWLRARGRRSRGRARPFCG